MKSFISKNLINDLKINLIRFPLVNACAWVAFSIICFFIHNIPSEPPPWTIKLLAVVLLGLPGFMATELFEEANRIRIRRRWYSKVLMLGWLIWQYFSLPDQMYSSHVAGLVLKFMVLLLLVSFAGYLNKRMVAYFWQFNKGLFFRLMQTVFYSGVLFLGISAAILAMEHLFLIQWPRTIYAYILSFFVFVFGPLFFTAGIPQSLDAPVFYPSGLKVFVQSVLVPLVLLYFIILYGYGIRIIWLWSFPGGWVAYLVLVSGVSAIVSVLLVWPISSKPTHPLTGFFNAWILKALIPLLGLMGLALYQRVQQYGWTEDRFLVAIFSVFLLINSAYLGFSNNKNIKIIPVSLALLLVLAFTGPWNIFLLSEKSQLQRLTDILERNQLTEKGQWQAAKRNDIPGKDLEQIENQIQYLYQHFGRRPFEKGLLDKKLLNNWSQKVKKGQGDFVSLAMEQLKLDNAHQIHRDEYEDESTKYASFGQQGKGGRITPNLEMLEFGSESYLLLDSADQVYSSLLDTEVRFRLKRKSVLELEIKGQSANFDLHNLASKGWETENSGEAEVFTFPPAQNDLGIVLQITSAQIQQKEKSKEIISVMGRVFITKNPGQAK